MTNLTQRDRTRNVDAFDRLFSGLLRSPLTAFDMPESASSWMPSADVVADGESYIFRFDLPGVGKDDIDINLENNVLTVTGERRDEHGEAESSNVFRREAFYGKFSRSFRLPNDADVSGVAANYRDGVLDVRIPKSAHLKARKVAINAD